VTQSVDGPGPSVRPELDAPALAHLDADLRRRLESVSSLLWADASAVDRADTLPPGHLEAFSAAGLYGIFAPADEGGLGLGFPEMCAVVEELASACAATTFVWVQHFRFLGSMLDVATGAALRARWRAPAITGAIKGGVALTGLMPGPARLVAEPSGDGWALHGEAPWVSGWDIVDVLVVVARAPGDAVVSMVLDARAQPGLTVAPARLSAINASRTVRLEFSDLVVSGDRMLGQEAYPLATSQPERLRLNGSFALGVAKRCCLLIGPSPLDEELRARRAELDDATGVTVAGARAAACELAVRAAHFLAVSRGSQSALVGDVAERLSREAALLLVFASRPAIKSALLQRLGGLGSGAAVTAP
jgi:alkylation response protein AidB-like acyl-CoA dehydrogenase